MDTLNEVSFEMILRYKRHPPITPTHFFTCLSLSLKDNLSNGIRFCSESKGQPPICTTLSNSNLCTFIMCILMHDNGERTKQAVIRQNSANVHIIFWHQFYNLHVLWTQRALKNCSIRLSSKVKAVIADKLKFRSDGSSFTRFSSKIMKKKCHI